MKINLLISIVCCLLYVDQSFAQKRNVYFLKNSGAEVKVIDSADFIRIVSEPDSGSVLFNVSEMYLNKARKLIGKSSRVMPLSLEGQCITYYPSGIKREIVNYKQNIKDGDAYEFYPNGQLYTYKKYISSNSGTDARFLIVSCNDSTGKALTVNGNGYYIRYDENFKNIVEEGNVKSGLKDGKWQGIFENRLGNKINRALFTEEYNTGKLISGQVVDENNKTYNYTVREAQPQYRGGMEAFYRYLAQNIRYPYNARRNNISGKVICQFVVEKDGSLTDFKVIRSPDNDLSEEALRILRQSPNWMPGIQFGQPVRVMYTVPIDFTLGTPR